MKNTIVWLMLFFLVHTVSGQSCSSHCDCSSSAPFCDWTGYCSSCDDCQWCSDGIDGTCGSCSTSYYPSYGWYSCASSCASDGSGSSSGAGSSCSSHWDCPCSHPFCHDSGNGGGECALCEECHYCNSGIDYTCGPCDTFWYPVYESDDCYSESHCGADSEPGFGGAGAAIGGTFAGCFACCGCAFGISKWIKKAKEAKEALQPGLKAAKQVAQKLSPKVKEALAARNAQQGQDENVEMAPSMAPLVLADNAQDEEERDLVRKWMRDNVRLPEYSEMFVESGFDRMDNVRRLSLADLGSMGITKVGHKKAIMAAISGLKAQSPGAPVAVAEQQGLLVYPPSSPEAAYQYSQAQ